MLRALGQAPRAEIGHCRRLRQRHRLAGELGAGQVVLGIPITETDSITALFGIDTNEILAFRNSTPTSIVEYIDAVVRRTFHAWRTELGWAPFDDEGR